MHTMSLYVTDPSTYCRDHHLGNDDPGNEVSHTSPQLDFFFGFGDTLPRTPSLMASEMGRSELRVKLTAYHLPFRILCF